MAYKIDLGAWNGIFAVPCDLVDRQLKLAGPAQLKALLYILRHSGRAIETAELGRACGVSPADAADAMQYWCQQGLLVCECGQLSPPEAAAAPTGESTPAPMPEAESVCASASINPAPAQPAPENSTPAAETAPKKKGSNRYQYDECCQMIAEDDQLKQMLAVIEGLLCHTLTHSEVSVFVTLVRWYGLPAPCVAMLVEYCREIGRPSIAYIEATGIGWVNEEITTMEQVDEKIARLRAARSAWTHVRTLLDIPERAPIRKEQDYCEMWVNQWKQSDELILLAYERCITNKGKLSMGYMNGILTSWNKKGIVTAEQAEADRAANSTAPRGKSTDSASGMYDATYNKEDIESILDDDWMDG